jgi:hypothetical protein
VTVHVLDCAAIVVGNDKVCLNKYFPDVVPIRNGLNQQDSLSILLFNFTWGHTIWKVQDTQEGLKCKGTLKLLAYVDVNVLDENINTVIKNKYVQTLLDDIKDVQ